MPISVSDTDPPDSGNLTDHVSVGCLTRIGPRSFVDRYLAGAGSWRLMAIDGVMIDLPDTEANLGAYGKPEGGTRRPFPQLRVVGLSECGSHALVAAAPGTIYQGERELARQLRDRISPDMLIIADRGFHSYELWREFLATGAALLWRAWSTITLEPISVLDDGSYLAE